MAWNDIQYHESRAQAELDLARAAASVPAASAHDALARLHLDKARELREARRQTTLKLVSSGSRLSQGARLIRSEQA
jgi:hypothetical protein